MLNILYNTIIDSPALLQLVDAPLIKRERRNEDPIEKIIKVIEKKYGISGYEDNFSPVKIAFIELACFTSSLGRTLANLRGKDFLVIGSHTGLEVYLLKSLGINAIGVEIDGEAIQIAREIGGHNTDNLFIHMDAVEFLSQNDIAFEIYLARNLNPLAPTARIVELVGENIKKYKGEGVVQWDGVYKEEEAMEIFAPKRGVVYNEILHELLDTFHKHILQDGRIRSRFVYKIA